MPRKPPPEHTRFRKGQSGNPKGRPRRSKPNTASAFDVVIEKTLTIRENGGPRDVTLEEALQHKTLQAAFGGDRAARNQILKMILRREKWLAENASNPTGPVIILHRREPKGADEALLLLGLARRNDNGDARQRKPPSVQLETWAVQAALSRRRGGARLTEEDVKKIKASVCAPEDLRWPRTAGK